MQILNLFKRGLSRKRRDLGENFGKCACLLFRQTLHLVLYNIDIEALQLWQSPAYLSGIFSVWYTICLVLFPYPAGTATTVSLQSYNAFNDWSCFIQNKLTTNLPFSLSKMCICLHYLMDDAMVFKTGVKFIFLNLIKLLFAAFALTVAP